MATAFERIFNVLVETLGVEQNDVVPQASFIDDLSADSLDLIELIINFEMEFGVPVSDDEAERWLVVQDAVNYAIRFGVTQ